MDQAFALVGLSPQVVVGLLVTFAVFATAVTVALPMLQGNELKTRMKVVALERDELRARERARLANEKDRSGNTRRASARQLDDAGLASKVVNRFNLKNALSDEKTVTKLRQAGYRGQRPLTLFLFARFALPFAAFAASLVYVFALGALEGQPLGIRLVACVAVAYAGFYLPNVLLANRLKKRQLSIGRAWPDALDLLLICVESGLASEAAFRRVSEEIGIQSVPLAEELVLLCAELSYLSDRRVAYENLNNRIGLETVRSATTALIQAERYGTPLGQALRVLAQESRDHRMNLAEKKAASLPPKLTVPMILFFLPVLFSVILGPAAIQIMQAMQ
ncbi:type II secretion system F family protein [Aureimonas leprariae]|uniref:Type II secretion system F family protein n=1 Tax=Plantimonas leprariae TaxID=2615207 RepID=A0A7V7PSZ5_9HYPH|nr:type II secretion system F family protein [Aureimonas leprariae]KAB0682702.1 type II secretion system F family protein [Aureimonas leprariae]